MKCGSYIAKVTISSRLREAHFKALKDGSRKLPEDIAPEANAHFNYLRDLKSKGKLFCGGPTVDFSWGLYVLEAASIEEARKLVEDDPGVGSGLLGDCEVVPWYHIF